MPKTKTKTKDKAKEAHFINLTFDGDGKVTVSLSATNAEKVWAMAALYNSLAESIKESGEEPPPGMQEIGSGLMVLTALIKLAEDAHQGNEAEA